MSEEKKQVALNEATGPQLRHFAENYLGMSFPGNTKEETMRAKIAAAWTRPEIPVEVSEEVKDAGDQGQEGAPPTPVTAEQQPPKPGKVRIILQRSEEAGGDDPVPVGVNGRQMLVPRGEEVEIPYPYFEALNNAVKDIYDPLPDGGISAVPRKVPAYPFQVVGHVS